MATHAPNFVHQTLPMSMGRPPLDNEGDAKYFTPLTEIFEGFHVTILDTIVDEVQRKVVMHCSSKAESPIGTYANEYMITLTMTEDGKLVERFDEYVDSKFTSDYIPRLREYLAKEKEGK
ncbi:hypothetical protein MMC28_010636 [Mycoblastus sanguinarius]|nr:hypothetical protein [Mycoblastus sanguinarius]